MLRLTGLSMAPERDSMKNLRHLAAETLNLPEGELLKVIPVRRSIDARRNSRIRILYTVDAELTPEAEAAFPALLREETDAYRLPVPQRLPEERPVIAGFGPAGMFLALSLAEAGLHPIVLERGGSVEERSETVRRFREGGPLDPDTNVQFGEGGAGTFSDGKLNTGISAGPVPYILRRLAEFGAPERILWDALPHVGTDILQKVVRNIRLRVLELGGEIRFHTRLNDLEIREGSLRGIRAVCGEREERIPCTALFLAVGHSARDTMELLHERGVSMEPKPFSMGVRIEHLRAEIDRSRYGRYAGHKAIGAASYRLSVHLKNGPGVYTFCMCPGGYVVSAASEPGGVVTNGMSYSGRAGENSNSALLVSLSPEQFPEGGVLAGMAWQRSLEQAAYRLGGGSWAAPSQRLGDFLRGLPSNGPGSVRPTCLPGVRYVDLHDLLPGCITGPMAEAVPLLGKQLPGFDSPDALLTGPETRSSSPVRILRTERLQSPDCRGLYPCGEGAGWAGGIVSAAADGLRCAEQYLRSLDGPGSTADIGQ